MDIQAPSPDFLTERDGGEVWRSYVRFYITFYIAFYIRFYITFCITFHITFFTAFYIAFYTTSYVDNLHLSLLLQSAQHKLRTAILSRTICSAHT